MDFEAVARWNAQRAEIERLTHLVSEYESRRALNLTDLATLQAELRATTQENMRLQERCEWLACMERQQRWRALLAEVALEAAESALETECANRIHQLNAIEQALARALGGFPWYCDDQQNFPGATAENGVCVGELVVEDLVAMAAKQLTEIKEA
jgi:hypothetical protein